MDFNDFRKKFEKASEKFIRKADAAIEKTIVRVTVAIDDLKEKIQPAFWTAIETGDAAKVEAALKEDPDLANKFLDERNKTTPLHAAASHGRVDVAKVLLKYGAHLDTEDSRGVTPMLIAASKGDKPMVELFVSRTDPTVNKLVFGETTTAVIAAAEQGHAHVVKYLAETAADLDLITERGDSALSVARQKLKFAVQQTYYSHDELTGLRETVSYLEQNIQKILSGAGRNDNIRTPLMQACSHEDVELASLILDKDRFNSLNKKHSYAKPATLVHGIEDTVRAVDTALKESVKRASANLVSLLLWHGAKQDINYEGDRTPIMEAVRFKRPDILKMLLDNDTSTINHLHTDFHTAGIMSPERTETVNSALTYAVKSGDTGAITLLLERGAKMDLATTKTPVDIAQDIKRQDIVKLLKQYESKFVIAMKQQKPAKIKPPKKI